MIPDFKVCYANLCSLIDKREGSPLTPVRTREIVDAALAAMETAKTPEEINDLASLSERIGRITREKMARTGRITTFFATKIQNRIPSGHQLMNITAQLEKVRNSNDPVIAFKNRNISPDQEAALVKIGVSPENWIEFIDSCKSNDVSLSDVEELIDLGLDLDSLLVLVKESKLNNVPIKKVIELLSVGLSREHSLLIGGRKGCPSSDDIYDFLDMSYADKNKYLTKLGEKIEDPLVVTILSVAWKDWNQTDAI